MVATVSEELSQNLHDLIEIFENTPGVKEALNKEPEELILSDEKIEVDVSDITYMHYVLYSLALELNVPTT